MSAILGDQRGAFLILDCLGPQETIWEGGDSDAPCSGQGQAQQHHAERFLQECSFHGRTLELCCKGGFIWHLLELALPCVPVLAMCKYLKTSKHSYLYQYWWIFANFGLKFCFIHPFPCNLFYEGILSRSQKAAPVFLSAFPVGDEVINGAKTWILSSWVKLMGAQLLHHQ